MTVEIRDSDIPIQGEMDEKTRGLCVSNRKCFISYL